MDIANDCAQYATNQMQNIFRRSIKVRRKQGIDIGTFLGTQTYKENYG